MKIGDFREEPNTQDCVRRRMLPPALGGLRFRVPPVPGRLRAWEYVKDQSTAVMLSQARDASGAVFQEVRQRTLEMSCTARLSHP